MSLLWMSHNVHIFNNENERTQIWIESSGILPPFGMEKNFGTTFIEVEEIYVPNLHRDNRISSGVTVIIKKKQSLRFILGCQSGSLLVIGYD